MYREKGIEERKVDLDTLIHKLFPYISHLVFNRHARGLVLVVNRTTVGFLTCSLDLGYILRLKIVRKVLFIEPGPQKISIRLQLMHLHSRKKMLIVAVEIQS